MVKLSKEELEKRKRQHENRVKFYAKKIEQIEYNEKRIGFKW